VKSQGELFAVGTGPPGLRYEPEFLSRAEESTLIESIQALPLKEARYKDYTAKRRTVSFGSDYDFSTNVRGSAPPVPLFLLPLQARVAAWLGVSPMKFEHVLIAEYQPGTALGWHRDVPDFELVCGISLGGACRMRFRPFPPGKKNRKEVLSLELSPRSAYVLRDDARWRWQHSIPPTKVLRYSITFRTLA
jgi:alkylated DNA repair dioxygenase AlkB